MAIVQKALLGVSVAAAKAAGVLASGMNPPTPPPRPAHGPGSTQYTHASVVKSVHGRGARGYYLFTPADPVPVSAPAVVFLHGLAELDPGTYGAWILHLVRRGHAVIFPRYQFLVTPPARFLPNAVHAVNAALSAPVAEGSPMLDASRFAIVGHSCGGLLAGCLAAVAVRRGLPAPRALMCVEPGRSDVFPTEDYAGIPAQTLVLTTAGDADLVTGDTDARRIFRGAVNVPPENRNMVTFRTDLHGQPGFVAGHTSPASIDLRFDKLPTRRLPGKPTPIEDASHALFAFRNALIRPLLPAASPLEYMGYWRLFDSLLHAAFTGRDHDAALGNTPRQRDMGVWSDGVRVKEPLVETA